jgi:hypothetical protein
MSHLDERPESAALKDRIKPKGPGTRYTRDTQAKPRPVPGMADWLCEKKNRPR